MFNHDRNLWIKGMFTWLLPARVMGGSCTMQSDFHHLFRDYFSGLQIKLLNHERFILCLNFTFFQGYLDLFSVLLSGQCSLQWGGIISETPSVPSVSGVLSSVFMVVS